MANITNFTFQGAVQISSVTGAAYFSFKPPTGAWGYKCVITGFSGSTPTTITDYTTSLNHQGTISVLCPSFVAGTTYTASIQYSTVAPPGTPVFSSTAVTTTFSVAASTAGLALAPASNTPEELIVVASSMSLTGPITGGTARCTGPSGYDVTLPVTIQANNTEAPIIFTGTIPGQLYTVVVTIPGLSSITRSVYSPVLPNVFGTPTVGANSITLPWVDGVGTATTGAYPFTTCMLYNENTETWISTQRVAIGVQTVTISGLDVNTSYQLYCWPMSAGGFAGISGPGGDHSITFVTGGTATGASFGINGWFYSPVSN